MNRNDTWFILVFVLSDSSHKKTRLSSFLQHSWPVWAWMSFANYRIHLVVYHFGGVLLILFHTVKTTQLRKELFLKRVWVWLSIVCCLTVRFSNVLYIPYKSCSVVLLHFLFWLHGDAYLHAFFFFFVWCFWPEDSLTAI